MEPHEAARPRRYASCAEPRQNPFRKEASTKTLVLAWILTRLDATCIPLRDGADAWGPTGRIDATSAGRFVGIDRAHVPGDMFESFSNQFRRWSPAAGPAESNLAILFRICPPPPPPATSQMSICQQMLSAYECQFQGGASCRTRRRDARQTSSRLVPTLVAWASSGDLAHRRPTRLEDARSMLETP